MSRRIARPSRAGEGYARTHREGQELDHSHPQKKPRFDVRNPSALAPDALEDDAILDADVIGSRGQQVRRNAVNIDGYDSDSDNDNFDARADEKAKAKGKGLRSADADDNDMFADLKEDFKDGDDSEGDAGTKKRKKAVKFIDTEDIQGQVESSKSGGHVSADFTLNDHSNGKGKGRSRDVESSSESEVDDETRANVGSDVDQEVGAGGKKIHAPKLDAFNMRNENDEGRFDEDGNFVRKAADPDAVHDIWLEGLSKKDMKRAKEAADKREEDRRLRDMEDDAVLTKDVLSTLIAHLERGETILEALARLGREKEKTKRRQNKNKNRRKLNESSQDVNMAEVNPTEVKRKETVEAITGAADLLLTRGQPDIYDAERELLIRQYRRETGEDWIEPSAAGPVTTGEGNTVKTKQWEYRWSDARDGREVHGPYDGSMMVQWNEAGYFGDGVEFRQIPERLEWSRVVDFL